jgi:hypothetical protein
MLTIRLRILLKTLGIDLVKVARVNQDVRLFLGQQPVLLLAAVRPCLTVSTRFQNFPHRFICFELKSGLALFSVRYTG